LKNGKQIKLSNGEGIEVAGEKVFWVKGFNAAGKPFPVIESVFLG
jgi:hypothetical protein